MKSSKNMTEYTLDDENKIKKIKHNGHWNFNITEKQLMGKNWVEHRAFCTLENKFKLLIDVIKADVEKYNKLQKDNESNFRCVCETPKPNEIIVTYKNRQGIKHKKENLSVEVIQRESDIVAYYYNRGHIKMLFELSIEWNAYKLECDLLISGKCYTIWEISQRALGELLFESS